MIALRILHTCCYVGIGIVAGLISGPATSGDWSAMWTATKYFGWVAAVLAIVIVATSVREK